MDLLNAAQQGDINTITKFLHENSDPEELRMHLSKSDEQGYTAIHWASYFDDIEIFVVLYQKFNESLKILSKRGLNCLHIAANQGSIRIVRFIVSHSNSIDINERNIWGESALHMAAANGLESVVAILVDAGASLSITDKWGRTPLKVAKENGHSFLYNYLTSNNSSDIALNEQPEDVTRLDENLSLQQSHKAVVAEFLQTLNNPTKMKNCDTLETHIFSNLNHLGNGTSIDNSPSQIKSVSRQTVDSLLEARIRIQSNRNPIHNHLSNNVTDTGNNAVSVTQMTSALIHDSTHLNSTLNKKIALSKKIEYPGDPVLITDMLLKPLEYDPCGKDMFGWTALHKFCAWDKVDLLELIFPYLSVEAVNIPGGKDGLTCLHMCVDMGSKHALEYLLKSGKTNLSILDKLGRTPKDFAIEKNNSEIILLFDKYSS